MTRMVILNSGQVIFGQVKNRVGKIGDVVLKRVRFLEPITPSHPIILGVPPLHPCASIVLVYLLHRLAC